MYTRNVKKTHKENTEKRPKKSKSANQRKSGQFRQQTSLYFHSPTDKFKLKNIDQILDICLQEYTETVETEIQNEELMVTDGVADGVAEFEGI